MITYRKAESKDLERVLNLIQLGFSFLGNSPADPKEGWENYVVFLHRYAQPEFQPYWVYLAEQKENLVAVVGVFPQQLSFEGNLIPVWSISPVATHPDYRGQGIAGKCLHWALLDLKSQGIPAVFLWGLPDYYPRFGFVPLLPRYKTKITQQQLRQAPTKIKGRFRPIQTNDWEAVAALYTQKTPKFWLQPERTLEWWKKRAAETNLELAGIKEVPFPQSDHLLVWEDISGQTPGGSGNVTGYLYYEKKSNQPKIYINESAAFDSETALEMAATFIKDYLTPQLTLYINGTPEHPLNNAAYHLGGTHLNPAPLAGMIKIIDWPEFLNRFLPALDQRLTASLSTGIADGFSNKTFQFHFKLNPFQLSFYRGSTSANLEFTLTEEQTLADNKLVTGLLTKLFFGLYEPEDLIALNQTPTQLLNVLFPQKYPFIWDKNYIY